MLERTLAAVAGVITLAALIFVAVAAAAIAIFALLEPAVTAAGAAAIVAGIFGLIAALAIAFVATRNDKPRDRDGDGIPDLGMVERLIDMAKDRPILSLAALVAGGVILFRNPAMVATIAAAFLDRPKR